MKRRLIVKIVPIAARERWRQPHAWRCDARCAPQIIQIRRRDLFAADGGDRLNRDTQETTMNKTVLALAAATTLAVSVLAAPPAEARCWGLCCWCRRRRWCGGRRHRRQCNSQFLRPGLRRAARLRGLPGLCGCGTGRMPRGLLGASPGGV